MKAVTTSASTSMTARPLRRDRHWLALTGPSGFADLGSARAQALLGASYVDGLHLSKDVPFGVYGTIQQ